MSCNFLLIPLTCASALSPDFCFGEHLLDAQGTEWRKDRGGAGLRFCWKVDHVSEPKINTQKNGVYYFHHFAVIAFVAALQSHILSEIFKEGIRDLRSSPAFIRATGRRLLWIGRNWRTVMDWFRHRSSRGERFPVVELTCWSTNLWGANLTTFFQFNAGWGECFFFAALIRVNWTLIDGYFVLHNRTGTLYINKYDK